MQLFHLLALCVTIAMGISLVLAGDTDPPPLKVKQWLDPHGNPLQYLCSSEGPRCDRWKGISVPGIEKQGTITIPAKTKKRIQGKSYAGVYYENHKKHEVKVPAKQIADEVRRLVNLCSKDCREKEKLQAIGDFEDHRLHMLHEVCP